MKYHDNEFLCNRTSVIKSLYAGERHYDGKGWTVHILVGRIWARFISKASEATAHEERQWVEDKFGDTFDIFFPEDLKPLKEVKRLNVIIKKKLTIFIYNLCQNQKKVNGTNGKKSEKDIRCNQQERSTALSYSEATTGRRQQLLDGNNWSGRQPSEAKHRSKTGGATYSRQLNRQTNCGAKLRFNSRA